MRRFFYPIFFINVSSCFGTILGLTLNPIIITFCPNRRKWESNLLSYSLFFPIHFIHYITQKLEPKRRKNRKKQKKKRRKKLKTSLCFGVCQWWNAASAAHGVAQNSRPHAPLGTTTLPRSLYPNATEPFQIKQREREKKERFFLFFFFFF